MNHHTPIQPRIDFGRHRLRRVAWPFVWLLRVPAWSAHP